MRRSQRPSWAERRGQQDERAARRGGSGKAMEARLVLRKYNYHVRRAHLVRMPATPMHTHTHTQHGHLLLGTLTHHALCTSFAPRPHHRFPCVHRWKHNGRFGANVQIGTTGDAARTCRSGGRADRVGARIGGAQVRWAHRSGVCVCSHVGRHAGARLQDGRCAGRSVAGRSVRRTIGLGESLPHIGMLCVRHMYMQHAHGHAALRTSYSYMYQYHCT